MKKFALIVAGGTGRRMGNQLPKQFMNLDGEPVLMHTIRRFFQFDSKIELILVLPESQLENWTQLCLKHNFNILHKIVIGGENRFYSVKNGLEIINEEGIVFIHDGVRPLISRETLERCYKVSLEKSNAIPVVPVTESLRKQKGNNSKTVDRTKYFNVQTPQTFLISIIKNAYSQLYNDQFTDDASVLEKTGQQIYMVEGNFENIKITRPLDMVIVEALLQAE